MIENTDNEWINEAPLLAGLQKPKVQLPDESYFNSLHNTILQRIKSAEEWQPEAPILASVDKPALQMPENEYFYSLPAEVAEKNKQADEWKVDAPVLASLQKPWIGQPGDEYFDELPSSIINRIHKEEAPVVRLIPAILRYASIAACMAGTLWLYKGLMDSDFGSSFAIHENVLFEADFNNMPELYDAEELAVYLAEGSSDVVVEKSPMMDELDEKLNDEDLESLLDL